MIHHCVIRPDHHLPVAGQVYVGFLRVCVCVCVCVFLVFEALPEVTLNRSVLLVLALWFCRQKWRIDNTFFSNIVKVCDMNVYHSKQAFKHVKSEGKAQAAPVQNKRDKTSAVNENFQWELPGWIFQKDQEASWDDLQYEKPKALSTKIATYTCVWNF